jgi:hypothetical protein
VLACVEQTTIGEMLKTWTKATGKPSAFVQVSSMEDFDTVWPAWSKEMGIMMKFWEEVGDAARRRFLRRTN